TKIRLTTEVPEGKTYNFKKDDAYKAEYPMSSLLQVNGVKGIYHVMNFMAVERDARVSWEAILKDIQKIMNKDDQVDAPITEEVLEETFGEVYVHVQTYKDIPLQVKVYDSEAEVRLGLSERFIQAMEEVHSAEVENYILLRKWADYVIRYGEKEEVAETIVHEVEAAYPNERLQAIIEQHKDGKEIEVTRGRKVTLEEFQVDEWEKRFQLLDQMPDPDMSDIDLLNVALEDEKTSIRRLATVYLGMIEDKAVIPYI